MTSRRPNIKKRWSLVHFANEKWICFSCRLVVVRVFIRRRRRCSSLSKCCGVGTMTGRRGEAFHPQQKKTGYRCITCAFSKTCCCVHRLVIGSWWCYDLDTNKTTRTTMMMWMFLLSAVLCQTVEMLDGLIGNDGLDDFQMGYTPCHQLVMDPNQSSKRY